jgi:hypothetical protein
MSCPSDVPMEFTWFIRLTNPVFLLQPSRLGTQVLTLLVPLRDSLLRHGVHVSKLLALRYR